MAVKKTKKTKDESAAPTKAEAKETAPKKTAKAKAPAPKAPAAEPAPTTPAPAPAEPAASTKPAKSAAPKKSGAPKKAAAPAIKLSASQGELLKKVGGAAEAGYSVEKKIEQRSIESLLEKKLIKKGAKDKATGTVRYHISSAGKKHIS